MDVNKKRQIHCVPGTVLFQNWQDPHYNAKHSETARGFHLEIKQEWLESHDLQVELPRGNNEIMDPKLLELFLKAHLEIQDTDTFSPQVMQDLIWQMLNQLSNYKHRFEKGKPDWILRAAEMVEELHPDQLKLENVSKEIGLHPVYFCREFPRHFQSSFGDYVRRTKLKRSLPLLAAYELPLAQIAFACGFADQSHFTRCFKKRYGITPHRYQFTLKNLR